MSTFVAELVGTAILILLGDGVVAAVSLNKSKAKDGGWIVIALGWGLGVAMAVYAIGQFSGAHLNPAVTLALAITGDTPWGEVPTFVGGQLVGAFVGAVLVWLTYLLHWRETDDPEAKLNCFCTTPAIPKAGPNVLTEAIGTFVLVLGVLAIATNGDSLASGLNPLLVGLLVVAIGLSLGGPTGYAINPARDLGPRIAHQLLPIPGKRDSDWAYAWVPIAGPLLGAALAAGVFVGLWPPA